MRLYLSCVGLGMHLAVAMPDAEAKTQIHAGAVIDGSIVKGGE